MRSCSSVYNEYSVLVSMSPYHLMFASSIFRRIRPTKPHQIPWNFAPHERIVIVCPFSTHVSQSRLYSSNLSNYYPAYIWR